MSLQKKARVNSNKYKATTCRICGSTKLYNFLSLDSMPIPNGFLTQEELKQDEPHYPLGVNVCEECWLVQLTHIIPPEIMFKNYLYIPSTSTTMLQHFKAMALSIIEDYSLSSNDLVVDIGSNDGTMLGFFKEQEVKVLGIDPASNLAQLARLKGIDTIDDFFGPEIAKSVVKTRGLAKVITGTNVVAHMNDIHSLCEGIEILLAKDGVFIMEFPYLIDLIDKNEFDTIYHEHLSYFSITPLVKLFKQHNMQIQNVKRQGIHGGSIRVYVTRSKPKLKPMPAVKEILDLEAMKKINKKTAYDDFARRVKVIRRDLVKYLKDLKSRGKRIVGYGASAKGNVLLNYCKISTDLLDYIVDSIPYKQGRYTPGTHIPIYPESRLDRDMLDYALLLAWNFADEILQKKVDYRVKGGQFIITIPYLRIE